MAQFDQGPAYVYVNLAGGLSGSSYATPQPAILSIAPTQGIVSNQGARFLAVSRVSLSGCRTLPAFCAPVDVTRYNAAVPSSVNRTVYGIRCAKQEWGAGGVAGVYKNGDAILEWVKQDTTAPDPLPQSPITGFDASSSYYFAYDVQWVIDRINVTMKAAFDAAGTMGNDPTNIPILSYDANSNLLQWNVPPCTPIGSLPRWYFDSEGLFVSNPSAEVIEVACTFFFNDALASLLSGFCYAREAPEPRTRWSTGYVGSNPASGSALPSPVPSMAPPTLRLRLYQKAFAPTGTANGVPAARYFEFGNEAGTVPSAPKWWVCQQTSASTDTWSPVSSIVLEGAGINATREIVIPPGNAGIDQGGGGNVTTFTESSGICDIVLASTRPTDSQGLIIFSPPFHRWTTLEGSNLASLKIIFKWRSTFDGKLRPVFFVPGASASCKLCFRDRSLGAGN